MATIEDYINKYVPAEYRHFFEGNQTVMNPSVMNRFEYFEWSNDTVCGMHVKHALKATIYMCSIFDSSTHLKLWRVCADQCLCICQG